MTVGCGSKPSCPGKRCQNKMNRFKTHLHNEHQTSAAAVRKQRPLNRDYPIPTAQAISMDRSFETRSMQMKKSKNVTHRSPDSNQKNVVQGKFEIENDKAYTKENKSEIPDNVDAQEVLKDVEYKDSLISILVSHASDETNHGTYTSWQDYIEIVKGEMKKDASQFDLTAQQIISRYPFSEWAYIGLGSSPDPVFHRITTTYNDGVVLSLPISNINQHNLNAILNILDVNSEDEMVKYLDTEYEEKTVRNKEEYFEQEGSEDYFKNIRIPFAQVQIVKDHLNQWVSISKLKGRKKVLLVDYVATGHSLQYATLLLRKYYGEDVEVQPFAFGTPINIVNKEFHYLKAEKGVEPEYIKGVFARATYKEGHRIYSKFDVLDLFKKIKKLEEVSGLNDLEDLDGLPEIEREEIYKEVELNDQSVENLKKFFNMISEEEVDLSKLSFNEGADLIVEMVKKYSDDVDEYDEARIKAQESLLL
jgi:hypothetical protein